eukprot:s1824_g2.t1
MAKSLGLLLLLVSLLEAKVSGVVSDNCPHVAWNGKTFVCRGCPVGYSQPSGASLACDPCPKGEYQDEEATSFCKRCEVGKYQSEQGQSDCRTCPRKTTTLGYGSKALSDARRETGSKEKGPFPAGVTVRFRRCNPSLKILAKVLWRTVDARRAESISGPISGKMDPNQTLNARIAMMACIALSLQLCENS